MWPLRRAWRGIKRVFGRKRKVAKKAYRRRNKTRPTGHLTVKKVVLDDRLTMMSGTTTYGSDTFELADFPQYASYVALYEEYKIDKIIYSFKSLNNVNNGSLIAAGTYVNTLGMIHTVVDHNDSVVPTSIQNMMNDSSYRGTRTSRNHTRTFKPTFMNSIGGTVAGQQKSGWLTCYNADGVTLSTVSHYGLKWAFQGGYNNTASPGVTAIIEPIITYYVSFRNPK